MNKASQLDRIEMTIGQVLNTVQGIATSRKIAVNVKGVMDESPSESSLPHQHQQSDLDQEQVPSRQHHSNDKQSMAQKMQDNLEM